MIRRSLLLSLLLAATTAGVASAQNPAAAMPAPDDFLGMMGEVRRELNPAARLLAHGAELELTAAQSAALQSLAEPMNRFLDEALVPQINPASLVVLNLMMNLTDEPVNEEEIRSAFREQADREAEMIIRMARMERDVNRVLTPEQRAKRVSLKLNSPFGLMRDMASSMVPTK